MNDTPPLDPNEKYIGVSVDSAELAVRIVEAMTGAIRPPDKTAVECLDQGLGDEERAGAFAAAKAACDYFFECLQAVSPKSQMLELPAKNERMN